MTLETANPIIVALILLPFVIVGLAIVVGALNQWYKHREPEPKMFEDDPEFMELMKEEDEEP